MIITQSDRDSKSSPTSDSTSVAEPSAHIAEPSPPAYDSVPRPSTPSESPMPLLTPSMELKTREPAWRRFAKALCFAVVVYSLLVMLVKSFIHLAENHLIKSEPDGPYESDGRVVRCANDILLSSEQLGQRQQPLAIDPPALPPVVPPYTSRTLYSVPVSSNLIFLLSRGSFDYSSSVNLELSENAGDDVEIDVTMSYFNNAALKRARVCLLERDEGGKGVGIFTPRWYFPRLPKQTDRIKIVTTIRFPKSGSEKPLVINALETNMGIWSHHITSFENQVVFKYLSLQGSSASIRVESVSAEAAKFKTSNSRISGTFNVSDSLVLSTSNGPIAASINLENHNNQNPTRVHARTTNGRINTPITLHSTQRYSWNPAAFSVNVGTTNGQLDVSFLDAPSSPFSILELTGQTTNSAADVKLHPTYEGSISLKTSSFFSAGLLQRQGTPDPSGQGRHRTVDIRKVVRSVFEAGVWWGDDPNKDEGKGKVEVSTTNSNNIVQLI